MLRVVHSTARAVPSALWSRGGNAPLSTMVLDGTFDIGTPIAREAAARGADVGSALMAQLERAKAGGGPKAVSRHVDKNGKLLVRDRIRLLLDKDAPFHELSALAGLELYPGQDVPAGGLVTGIGAVHGQQVVVIANDATVKGGTIYPIGIKKQLRAQEIAAENSLPVLYLVDSGGAFLPLQAEIFADKEMGGRTFFNEALLSAAGVPQLALVCGSCTAGGAYVPAMADESIIVRGIGSVYLGGPPLVLAATGEVVTSEQLGGAEVHCAQSGLTDHFAETEEDGLRLMRDLVAEFNLAPRLRARWCVSGGVYGGAIEGKGESEGAGAGAADGGVLEPKFDPADLGALGQLLKSGANSRSAKWGGGGDGDGGGTCRRLLMRQILARVLDGSRLVEVKQRYGTSVIVGFGRVHGHPVGIIANAQAAMCGPGLRKGAQFVQLCNARGLPIVFLQASTSIGAATVSQSTGDSAGSAGGATIVEAVSAVRESALMLQAIACSTVPKITIVLADSVGAANYVMCGRSQSPAFLYSWPGARVTMEKEPAGPNEDFSPKSAADAEDKERGEREDDAHVEDHMKVGGSFYGSARLWDDGVILPEHTRDVLRHSLEAARHSLYSSGDTEQVRGQGAPVFRM